VVRERGALREPAAEQFAYSLLTRSQRISHENLRLRDTLWRSYEDWIAGWPAAAGSQQPIPPMFTPFTVRGSR
jgi:anthraniloyl-CoA monooxygenase